MRGYVSVHVHYPDFEILCVSTGGLALSNAISECQSDLDTGTDFPYPLTWEMSGMSGKAVIDDDRWYEIREVTVHE